MHDEVYCLFIVVLGMLALLVPASTQVPFVGFAVVLAILARVSRQEPPPRRSADPDWHRIGEG